jgi:thiamine biosynthesis protein ThiS
MHFIINGQPRELGELTEGSKIEELVLGLGLEGDRVAVEQNGTIVPRAEWARTSVANGDKLEIVHFVGGGRGGGRG